MERSRAFNCQTLGLPFGFPDQLKSKNGYLYQQENSDRQVKKEKARAHCIYVFFIQKLGERCDAIEHSRRTRILIRPPPPTYRATHHSAKRPRSHPQIAMEEGQVGKIQPDTRQKTRKNRHKRKKTYHPCRYRQKRVGNCYYHLGNN